MDLGFINFEPNLNVTSELNNDLKEKYNNDPDEMSKHILANFSSSLQKIYHDYHKLVLFSVDLLKKSNKSQEVAKKNDNLSPTKSSNSNQQCSEILSASPNFHIVSKTCGINKKLDDKINNDFLNDIENIADAVPIYTEDFNTEIEGEILNKNKSPARPILDPVKVQSSPILSKSKRSLKKNNSSTSNNSLTSSNESKISWTNTPSDCDNNVELDVECIEKIDREPLREIENDICTTPKSQYTNSVVLSVSRTEFGKIDFLENGKKLRQSKLILSKAIPVIDISKNDCDKDLTEKNSLSKTFFSRENSNKNKSSNKRDDELEYEQIESSPTHNERSKLRNKLNLQKTEINKSKNKHKIENNNLIRMNLKKFKPSDDNNEIKVIEDNEDNFKKFSKPSTSVQKKIQILDGSKKNLLNQKKNFFEGHKTMNDETYFSPAEVTNNKIDLKHNEINSMDSEDEFKTKSPPLKKLLMSSFDIVPGREEKSLGYAYKEKAVRKKVERAKLPGWSCHDCEKYYDHLPPEEKIKRQNECSRHRAKFRDHAATPESFWNPVIDEDCNDSLLDG